MFTKLDQIVSKPKVFEFYTAKELWDDDYTSEQMLKYHLNESVDLSSRNHQFINRSVEWIDRYLCKSKSRIIDFGCGPGLYTSRLAKKGHDVIGVDFSKRSIEYARKNDLSSTYIHQDYLTFKTDQKADIIIMIMCDFCVLSSEQRKQLLQVFRESIKSDGKILFDVYSEAAFNKREESKLFEENLLNSFWAQEKYYGFLNTFKYENERVVLDKYDIITKNDRKTIYNWLQYFSLERLKKVVEESGLNIVEVVGDVAGGEFKNNNDEFGVILKKV